MAERSTIEERWKEGEERMKGMWNTVADIPNPTTQTLMGIFLLAEIDARVEKLKSVRERWWKPPRDLNSWERRFWGREWGGRIEREKGRWDVL